MFACVFYFFLGSLLGFLASEFADRWGCSQRYRSALPKKLFIVLMSGIGAAWLYWWEVKYQMSLLPVEIPYHHALQPFILHIILFTFLLAATLTDFYEMIIPDTITVAGTLTALLIAILCLHPGTGLPTAYRIEAYWDGVDSGGCSYALTPLNVWSPNSPPECNQLTQWTRSKIVAVFRTQNLKWVPLSGIYSLIIMILLWWFWCFAMLDRVWYSRLPFRKAQAIFWRYLYRSPRTKYIIAAAVIVPLFFEPLVSDWKAETALLSALTGMAAGMILIWAIRLTSRWVLGVEAMGFGDVTLMGMIGAFLGWQPVLLIFFAAPFFGLIYGIINLLLGKGRAVPYGPFLCLATVVVVIAWSPIWSATAEYFAFGIGVISAVMFVMLILFGVLLYGVHQIFQKIGKH